MTNKVTPVAHQVVEQFLDLAILLTRSNRDIVAKDSSYKEVMAVLKTLKRLNDYIHLAGATGINETRQNEDFIAAMKNGYRKNG